MTQDIIPTNALDDDAVAAIAELVLRQRRANGVLMTAINFVGGQVEDGLKMLPKGARAQIDVAARRALEASYDAASRSRTTYAGSDTLHKALGAISGALGGLGGLPTALAELPIATTVIFRAVQGVAARYGEDPLSVETRVECLAVFGSGGPGTADDGVDTSFFGARIGLTGAAVHGIIGKVAPRFATVLTQKLASQAVPILGAAAGAGTNYAFTDYYVQMAHVHFGLRKLAREHGEAPVLDEFHRVLAFSDVPVKRD
ncbi:MAG: EcsC family protein [Yoonia sp.]|nr:EcsC family protein [Yoonia sp.]